MVLVCFQYRFPLVSDEQFPVRRRASRHFPSASLSPLFQADAKMEKEGVGRTGT